MKIRKRFLEIKETQNAVMFNGWSERIGYLLGLSDETLNEYKEIEPKIFSKNPQ